MTSVENTAAGHASADLVVPTPSPSGSAASASYDVIVLGGGPGGYIAAERLGHAGKKVLLIEKEALGGTCLNVGCIPTKSLLNSAKIYAHAKHGGPYGVDAPGVTFDWARMQAWKSEVVATLVGGVGALQRKLGVTVLTGHGRMLAPVGGRNRVVVGETTYDAADVIIATGSVPVLPSIPGARDNAGVVDSTGLLSIDTVPQRLAVIGGGVIGLEFASLFAALGSTVSVIEMTPEIVPFMDADLAARMRRGMPDITFHLRSRVEAIEGSTVLFADPKGAQQRLDADLILMAVGRKPLVDGWGAQESGLDVSARGVVVDDRMRTNLPGVWAVGDVTGRSLLAHAAYRMGEVAAAHLIDPVTAQTTGQLVRWDTIPWAIYSIPEAAGVGLTQAQAKDRGLDVVTATVPLVLSGRFVAENGLKAPGAVKLIAEKTSRVVRGIHVLGAYAPEMIWGAAAVLEQELTVDDLRQVVFPHPTVSEGIREAAWAVKD